MATQKYTTSTTTKTQRRTLEFPPCPVTDLSFVDFSKRYSSFPWVGNYWSVPPTDDYGQACDEGMQMFVEFTDWLLKHGGEVGGNILGRIALSQARSKENHGFAVGFWIACEHLLRHASERTDVQAGVQWLIDRSNEIELARQEEARQASEELESEVSL